MSHVVGTAGHVDHGKSALIQALTGIDPDRLPDEKRRGLTIDLGFAHLTLPSGREVGIVDVPGHARFVHNMLAGVSGLDAVLLVVAADEGVMPQTREHLDIIDLLDLDRGLVVITKSDLVDGEWLELVRGEVRDALAGTSLAAAEMAAVSALTGTGLPELIEALDRTLALTPDRADRGRPRLPVDRVFTIGGFGTVVTGTLTDGRLRVGDELEFQPTGLRARVRGLQQHNQQVVEAVPGSRVAANLGGVEKAELERGEVAAPPGGLRPTRRLDVSIRVLSSAPRPLRHGDHLQLHTGTSEVPARVILLDEGGLEPDARAFAQLYLGRPLAAVAGDRYVIRLPSPATTVAGGVIVDAAPRRHRRGDVAARESIARRLQGHVLEEELRKHPHGITEEELSRAVPDWPRNGTIAARRVGRRLFAPAAWANLAARAVGVLTDFHARHPLRAGMPREELRSRLGLAAAAFPAVVAALAEAGAVVDAGGGDVKLPRHQVRIDPAEGGPAGRLLELLADRPFAPPSLSEAMREAGAGPEVARALADRGDLVRLSDDVALTASAYEAAVALVREMIVSEGSVSVATLRDRMATSRRPALALLEHLDGRRVTRRLGDARVLR